MGIVVCDRYLNSRASLRHANFPQSVIMPLARQHTMKFAVAESALGSCWIAAKSARDDAAGPTGTTSFEAVPRSCETKVCGLQQLCKIVIGEFQRNGHMPSMVRQAPRSAMIQKTAPSCMAKCMPKSARRQNSRRSTNGMAPALAEWP